MAFIAAVVSIISRCGLRIEAHHRNHPTKSKVVLCKLLTVILTSCTLVTRWSTSVIKVDMAYVSVATRIEIFTRRAGKEESHFEFCMDCYVVLSNVP